MLKNLVTGRKFIVRWDLFDQQFIKQEILQQLIT